MGGQATELLKGTLEGIVLAILDGRPAYGYEITAWLREQGNELVAQYPEFSVMWTQVFRGEVKD